MTIKEVVNQGGVRSSVTVDATKPTQATTPHQAGQPLKKANLRLTGTRCCWPAGIGAGVLRGGGEECWEGDIGGVSAG